MRPTHLHLWGQGAESDWEIPRLNEIGLKLELSLDSDVFKNEVKQGFILARGA